jgi:hypothetical protein
VCQAATDLAKFANQAYLDKAAQRFRLGRGGLVVMPYSVQMLMEGGWHIRMSVIISIMSVRLSVSLTVLDRGSGDRGSGKRMVLSVA